MSELVTLQVQYDIDIAVVKSLSDSRAFFSLQSISKGVPRPLTDPKYWGNSLKEVCKLPETPKFFKRLTVRVPVHLSREWYLSPRKLQFHTGVRPVNETPQLEFEYDPTKRVSVTRLDLKPEYDVIRIERPLVLIQPVTNLDGKLYEDFFSLELFSSQHPLKCFAGETWVPMNGRVVLFTVSELMDLQ